MPKTETYNYFFELQQQSQMKKQTLSTNGHLLKLSSLNQSSAFKLLYVDELPNNFIWKTHFFLAFSVYKDFEYRKIKF